MSGALLGTQPRAASHQHLFCLFRLVCVGIVDPAIHARILWITDGSFIANRRAALKKVVAEHATCARGHSRPRTITRNEN